MDTIRVGSRDSKELFYVQNDTLMAVAVTTAPNFSVGSTRPLFSDPGLAWPWTTPNYDVSPDGKRFLMVETLGAEQAQVPAIHVVQDWYEEFRDRGQD